MQSPSLCRTGRGAGDKAATKAAAKALLSKIPEVINVVDTEEGLTLYVKNGGLFVPELVRAFDKTDIELMSINISTPSLDDVFLKHTGRGSGREELVKEVSSWEVWEQEEIEDGPPLRHADISS